MRVASVAVFIQAHYVDISTEQGVWHESFKMVDINGQLGLGPMFVTLLPVLFLALAIHPSVSSEGAAPSAARALCVPRTTLIDGRLFYRHSLLPVDVGLYDEDKRGWSKRVMLEAALDSLLIKPLVGIVVEYNSYASCSRQFAEEMYHELWEGRTDLLKKELYDFGVLKEPHHFWDYLSRGAQPAAAFAQMLWETRKKHQRLKKTLKSFAKLVSVRVSQTSYFVARYFDSTLYSLLHNISVDEWPQALLNDRVWSKSIGSADYSRMAELHYMLMQGNLPWLKKYIKQITWRSEDWIDVFCLLHAVEPAFLHRFFEIHFAKGSSGDRSLFNETAPIAMGVDPALSNALIAIARENDWKEPVAEKMEMQAKLADHKEAGGDVHIQPLQPVAQSPDAICSGAWYAASSTLKTVANGCTLRLHIAAGNVLCALSTTKQCYLHIRTFENDKVSTHELDVGHSVQVQVQHGDVIISNWSDECPSFLKAMVADRGLTRGGCFECLKAFCYAAKKKVYLLAIVQTDRLVAEEATTLAAALSASAVKAEKMDKRKTAGTKGEKRERGAHEQKVKKEKRKKKSEKNEERTSKKPKKEHGDTRESEAKAWGKEGCSARSG